MSEPLNETGAVKKPGPMAYAVLIFACLFFSGLLESEHWYGIFDFTVLCGSFGTLVSSVKSVGGEIQTTFANFRGQGGSGAIDGFLFAISLIPSIMLSVGALAVFEHYGAINAAERVFNLIMRPLMGVPGVGALGLVASLQSTDAGAAITRTLKDEQKLTERETLIFATFQMTAGAAIGNFLSSGVVLFTLHTAAGGSAVPTTIGTCLGIILLGKIFSANVMRLLLIRADRKA